MAKELSVLQQQAEAIKTEVNKGANTSSRIGGMFGDILEYNEGKFTELEGNVTIAKSNLFGYNSINYDLIENNILIKTISGEVISESSFEEWGSLKIKCNEGDFFYISCYGGMNGRGYAFIDSSNIVIECSNSLEFVQRIIYAPKNAVYLIVNNSFSENKNPYPYVIKLSYKSVGNGFINLAWMGAQAPNNINIGDIGYNSNSKLLRVKVSDSDFKTIFFEKNALYYYNNTIYKCVEGELKKNDVINLKGYTMKTPVDVSSMELGDVLYSALKGLLFVKTGDNVVTTLDFAKGTLYKYSDIYHIWEPNINRLIPFDFLGNAYLKKFSTVFTGEGLTFGDICYNSTTKLLRRYIGEEDGESNFETMPFVDGAIYTYNGAQYYYDKRKGKLAQYDFSIKPTNVVGIYLPHKKVLLSAGSLSQYNGYFEYAMKSLGLNGTNISVAGKNIMDLAHTLYTNGSYKSVDLTDIDVLILSHVHNFDVYSLPSNLENYKPSDYEDDKVISPYIKTSTYTDGNLSGNSTYTADELYAIGYDYSIKKWKELCYNLKGTNGYDSLLGKPAQIIMYTYWHDARVTFNTAIRKLAKKWCIPLIKDDENIGFSKEKVNPLTNAQESLLHCNGYPWDATEVIDGVTYGFHPSGIPESVGWEKFLSMELNDMLKNMPYIQIKRASILINTLKNVIIVE